MKNTSLDSTERISALADGQLHGEEFTHAVTAVLGDPQALHTWHAYHVVGDVLRSDGAAAAAQGLDFLNRLISRLEQEPGYPMAPAFPDTGRVDTGANARQAAVNAQVMRWRMVAGVACMGFAGLLGFGLWGQESKAPGVNLLAVAPAGSVAQAVVVSNRTENTEAGVMLRDPVLDGLVREHQRLGGHSALQLPAGFMRSAVYEGPNR